MPDVAEEFIAETGIWTKQISSICNPFGLIAYILLEPLTTTELARKNLIDPTKDYGMARQTSNSSNIGGVGFVSNCCRKPGRHRCNQYRGQVVNL